MSEVPDWMIDESNRAKAEIEQLKYLLEQSENVVGDLSYLVKQLVHSIKMDRPDNVLAERAMDYLKRKELCGSPLRDETEKLRDALRYHIKVYQVDDQEWDKDEAADRIMANILKKL